ncbi:MAG: hypothetical protein GF364_06545 [Candidatus Lokiarchaeota archaeon]|nr:hypothetical protein [Candidatus Lokiarchaeota archaeon]
MLSDVIKDEDGSSYNDPSDIPFDLSEAEVKTGLNRNKTIETQEEFFNIADKKPIIRELEENPLDTIGDKEFNFGDEEDFSFDDEEDFSFDDEEDFSFDDEEDLSFGDDYNRSSIFETEKIKYRLIKAKNTLFDVYKTVFSRIKTGIDELKEKRSEQIKYKATDLNYDPNEYIISKAESKESNLNLRPILSKQNISSQITSKVPRQKTKYAMEVFHRISLIDGDLTDSLKEIEIPAFVKSRLYKQTFGYLARGSLYGYTRKKSYCSTCGQTEIDKPTEPNLDIFGKPSKDRSHSVGNLSNYKICKECHQFLPKELKF